MGKVMATATTQERHPIILISCSTLFLCARLLSSSITPHPDPFCSMTASGPRFCFFVALSDYHTHWTCIRAIVMDADRCLFCYKYINHSVCQKYKEAVLWVDTAFKNVQFHCVGCITPWHGTWTDLGDQMVIRFDSKYDSVHHTPVLKAVNLFLSSEREIFHGVDYQGRFVELIPVSMWKFVPPAPNTGDTIGGWALHANFQGRPEGEWVLV